MTGRAPERRLEEIAGRQRALILGAIAATGFGVAALAGTALATAGAGASVRGVEVTARRIDALREVATRDFARRPLQGEEAVLGQVLVNLVDSANLRYLRCSVTLTVTDRLAFEEAEGRRTRAIDAVASTLGARTVAELTAVGGLDAARDAVRDRIAPLYPEGLVLGVHFAEFVVQ